MTLTPFDPNGLDALALRVLDLAGSIRKIADEARENGLSTVPLNAQKARQWLGDLEAWARDSQHRVRERMFRQAGVRRADAPAASTAKRGRGDKRPTKKRRKI